MFPKRRPLKRKTVPEGKRRTVDEMGYWDLIKILDREYSFNLRAGAAARKGQPWLPCYTCGSIHHWKELDCGHFIGREWIGTRFDPRNTKLQCHKCNRFAEGEKATFAANLARDGVDLERINALAQSYGKQHLPNELLIKMIREYREKNAQIRKAVSSMEG